jgi:hypothetical protein
MESNQEGLALVLGAVLVAIYAFDRFNRPTTNRSSTTPVNYFSGATVYAAISLAAFLVLSQYKNAIVHLLGENSLPEYVSSLPPALVAALVLTVFLEKIPQIAVLDTHLRERLQYMARIPHEVRRISSCLQSARFVAPEEMLRRVRRKLADSGIDENDFQSGNSESFRLQWMKAAVLLEHMKDWETQRRYSAFMAVFAPDFQTLQESHRRLTQKVIDCKPDASGSAKETELYTKLRKHFQEDLDGLLQSICDFIARGMLRCHFTENARHDELRMMGFKERRQGKSFTPHQVANLFLIIASVLWLGIEFSGSSKRSFVHQLAMVAMVATTYCVAVLSAVYFMRRLGPESVKASGERHTAFYLLAGLVAAGLGFVISLAFRYAMHGFDLGKALEQAAIRYPWGLLTFATAAAIAFNIDNGSNRFGNMQRWVEAGIQALVMAIAAYLAYAWLLELDPQRMQRAALNWQMLVFLSAVNGFLLGYLVPTWYRGTLARANRGRRDSDTPRLEAVGV